MKKPFCYFTIQPDSHTGQKQDIMPTRKNLFLKNTKSSGKGVFTKSSVGKGTILIEYKGQRRRWTEYDNEIDMDYVCLMHCEDEFVIDPRINGNIARFINHSCAPNCEIVYIKKLVFIKTLRKILGGEEITYDYEMGFDSKPTKKDCLKFPCSCGTSKCRGTLLK